MPSLLEDHRPGPVVEMLYVEHCPNFPAALALVEQVAAELGINAEVWATMITDRPRPNTPGLWAPPQSVSTAGCPDGEYTLDCRLYRISGVPSSCWRNAHSATLVPR
jgi:hypothetical protein